MNVKAILAAKKRNLGGDIVSIEPTANLAAAAKSLSAHRIGAVLIRGAAGRLAGILSERDIVRALSEHGADALALPVGQVMTREVTTCGEDDSVASTGKSSLVDAGMLPRVEESGLPGMARCVCKRMVPSQGNHPFDALMRVLHSEAERAGIDPFETGQRLLSEPSICSELLRTIISQGMSADGLVLFLDQMEELFTGQTKERTATFISALYGVVNEVPLRVIGTIRSDFLHYCHEHDDLLKVLRGSGHYPLGRVENYVIADIIVKPAQCAGLSISEGLMRRLIRYRLRTR